MAHVAQWTMWGRADAGGDNQLGEKNNRVSDWWKQPPNGCVLEPRAFCKHNCFQFYVLPGPTSYAAGGGCMSSLLQCINDNVNSSLQEPVKSSLGDSSPSFTSSPHSVTASLLQSWLDFAVGKSELHTHTHTLFTPTTGTDTSHTTIKDVSSTFTHLFSLQPLLLLF